MAKDTPRLINSNTIWIGYDNTWSIMPTIKVKTAIDYASSSLPDFVRESDKGIIKVVPYKTADYVTFSVDSYSSTFDPGIFYYTVRVVSVGDPDKGIESDVVTFTLRVAIARLNPPQKYPVTYTVASKQEFPMILRGTLVCKEIRPNRGMLEQPEYADSPGVFVGIRNPYQVSDETPIITSVRGPACVPGRKVVCVLRKSCIKKPNKGNTDMTLYRTGNLFIDNDNRLKLMQGIKLTYDEDKNAWVGSGNEHDFKISRTGSSWTFSAEPTSTATTYIRTSKTVSLYIPGDVKIPPSSWGATISIFGEAIFNHGNDIYDYKGCKECPHYEYTYDPLGGYYNKNEEPSGTHLMEYYQARTINPQFYEYWGEYGTSTAGGTIISYDTVTDRFVMGVREESIPIIGIDEFYPGAAMSPIAGAAILAAGGHDRDFVFADPYDRGVNAGFSPDSGPYGISFCGKDIFNMATMHAMAGHGYPMRHRILLNYKTWTGSTNVYANLKISVTNTKKAIYKSTEYGAECDPVGYLNWIDTETFYEVNASATLKVTYKYSVEGELPICFCDDTGTIPQAFGTVSGGVIDVSHRLDIYNMSSREERADYNYCRGDNGTPIPNTRKKVNTTKLDTEFENSTGGVDNQRKATNIRDYCIFYTVTGPENHDSDDGRWSDGADARIYTVPKLCVYTDSMEIPRDTAYFKTYREYDYNCLRCEDDASCSDYHSSSSNERDSYINYSTIYINLNQAGIVPTVVDPSVSKIIFQAGSFNRVKANFNCICKSGSVVYLTEVDNNYNFTDKIKYTDFDVYKISGPSGEYIEGPPDDYYLYMVDPKGRYPVYTRIHINGTFDGWRVDYNTLPKFRKENNTYYPEGSDIPVESLPDSYVLTGEFTDIEEADDLIDEYTNKQLPEPDRSGLVDFAFLKGPASDSHICAVGNSIIGDGIGVGYVVYPPDVADLFLKGTIKETTTYQWG